MADETEHALEGQNFYNSALTGSGTIRPDGTMGPPEPDPSVKRGTIELPRPRHEAANAVKAEPADEPSLKRKPTSK